MSYWLPASGKVYLPPSRPVARVLSTDDYVQETSLFFHASSDRLLTVGHPYFPVKDPITKAINVPKVSGNQFRVFRLQFPDPNRFALVDPSVYNPDTERLVWKLRGIEVIRGGPLGIGSTGHPLFNKLNDTENPNNYLKGSTDNRQNVSLDPKQTQLLIVGCVPCTGAHWDAAKACAEPVPKKGDCPPLQLINSIIEDGDMCDIGFGAMNFNALQQDRSGAPLDIVATTCKWPDLVKMSNNVYGDDLFFFGKREQEYARHYFTRHGVVGDSIPQVNEDPQTLYVRPGKSGQQQNTVSSPVYFATPSGSLVTSDAQILNRPYWMQRAQGMNNGVCWNNNLFVTVVDNTHNTNFTISQYSGAQEQPPQEYDSSDYKVYLRHVEEFDISVIVQICKISLDADILAHLNTMNPTILENWNLAFVPPPASGIEDHYRYINSLATRCPDQNPPPEKEDPYAKYNFWAVDMTDKMSNDLTQTSLGRRFVYQIGLAARTNSLTGKRKRVAIGSSNTSKSSKRKRKS
ncbi:L1 protein [Human papillomavirus 109]|uniref:Major capsid protein L1 n=2 Tax=Papillomaviridae TaxID=151340 RepID=C1ID90_9PAPI|nr:L1 protein [Human papillomavirus 109]ACD67925.1 L1 protein [Human papillomavirus 109]